MSQEDFINMSGDWAESIGKHSSPLPRETGLFKWTLVGMQRNAHSLQYYHTGLINACRLREMMCEGGLHSTIQLNTQTLTHTQTTSNRPETLNLHTLTPTPTLTPLYQNTTANPTAPKYHS